MPHLFSTYKQGENRITATFLAVLQRLSLPNIDRILGALLGETSFSLVSFENQPKTKKSTPDALIGTASRVWIETKIKRNSVRHKQITNHMEALGDGEKLLLLTPDDKEPVGLNASVVWSNFNALAGAIGEILEDDEEPPSEKEAFLLREFLTMIREDGLLPTSGANVVVVGASHAWSMYSDVPAYRSSPRLRFRPWDHFEYMAFYLQGKIMPVVPKIKGVLESINVTREEELAKLDPSYRSMAEALMRKIESSGSHNLFDSRFNVMFLSEPSQSETVCLENAIFNDKKGKNGKSVPFTYGKPRYVTLESLKKATKTNQLKLMEWN